MSKVLPVRELFKVNPVELKNSLKSNLVILFEDGIAEPLTCKDIIFLRFLMDIFINYDLIKIRSEYNITKYYSEGEVTSKTINNFFEVVLKDVIEYYVRPMKSRKILEQLFLEMYTIVNKIYNVLTYTSQDYCNSISIRNLLDIQLDPELIKSMQDVYNIRKQSNIEGIDVKDKIDKTYKILDKVLRTKPKIKDTALARGYKNGTLNPNQIKQLLASRGCTTEIDSKIFKYPIASSFVLGLTDIYDLSIESRSGAKALFLSNEAIKKSEYFARELQLITMVVEKLVDGDCGQRDYIDWYIRPRDQVTKSDLKNLVGKYYYNPETKQEEIITTKHTHLEGKMIKLRSSLNCKLQDPTAICARCFGELANTIPLHSNIGHFSSTSITEKLSQSILSTKHLTSSASTGEVHLDDEGKKFFEIKNNHYVFLPGILTKKRKVSLLVAQQDTYGLKDLNAKVDIFKINPERVSHINGIVIRIEHENGDITEHPIVVQESNKRGSFTSYFLHYIIQTGYTLDSNNRYVVNIDNWNHKLPIITMPELEYNFLALANNIKAIFKNIEVDKKDRTKSVDTPESLLQKVFDMVNTKLDVNISLLEVVVYAFTIRSIKDNDYRLGRNAPDRQLAKAISIITNRSLGGGYGWQYVSNLIMSPKSFYHTSNVPHPLDVLIKPEATVREYHPERYQ